MVNSSSSCCCCFSVIQQQSAVTHLCRMDMTVLAVLASSPVVGSSRNRIPGEVISSIPMLTRLRSPPLTPRINAVPTCTTDRTSARVHP